MKITIELTEEDIFAFAQYQRFHSSDGKRYQRHGRLLFLILFVVVATLIHRENLKAWEYYVLLLIGGVFYFFMPFIALRNLRREIKNLIEKDTDNLLIGQKIDIFFEEEGIFFSTKYTENTIRWEGIFQVVETSTHFFIFSAKESAIIIPKKTTHADGIQHIRKIASDTVSFYKTIDF